MVQNHSIQPTYTARTACYSAVLMTTLADIVGTLIEELCGEWTLANASGVGLSYAHNIVDVAGCNARVYGNAGCRRARRCYEGICAVVDAEHNALSTLEQHLLALLDKAVEQNRGIANHRTKLLAKLQILVVDGVEVARLHAESLKLQILLSQSILQALCEVLLVEQIADADTYTAIFIGICRADALLCSANLTTALQRLVCAIEHRVIGHNAGRTVRYKELVVGDARLMQAVELLEQRYGVDNHTVGHNVYDMGVEDTRRDRLQRELLAIENDGMTGIVTALVAYYNIGTTSIKVGDFALALVAPLSAYNNQSITHSAISFRPTLYGGII